MALRGWVGRGSFLYRDSLRRVAGRLGLGDHGPGLIAGLLRNVDLRVVVKGRLTAGLGPHGRGLVVGPGFLSERVGPFRFFLNDIAIRVTFYGHIPLLFGLVQPVNQVIQAVLANGVQGCFFLALHNMQHKHQDRGLQ